MMRAFVFHEPRINVLRSSSVFEDPKDRLSPSHVLKQGRGLEKQVLRSSPSEKQVLALARSSPLPRLTAIAPLHMQPGRAKGSNTTSHTSSTNSGAWKGVNAEKLLVDLLRSTIPQAYVDIIYDFFMNIIPKGVFENQITKGEVLGSSYSHCAEVGSEKLLL